MTRDEILTRLSEIIRQETGYTGDITEDMRLVEDIGADSLRLMTIVTAAEAAFGIAIPDQALLEMKSVGNAVDYIESALAR
jgi:acyl carrier protein